MITIFNDKLKVQIDDNGAEIKSVTDNIKEYMHDGDKKYWGRTAPVLFPIVGALKDNKYTYENKEYELKQHGFARDKKFEVLEHEDNYCSFILSSDEDTLKMYPFEFTLIIEYLLIENKIEITYKVTNTDDKTMYYQIGAHPAFKINNENKYRIDIENCSKLLGLSASGLISDETNEADESFVYKNELFDNDALIYDFNSNEKIVTLFENNRPYIKMSFSDFKLLGIWTPIKLDAPFICLEPWNGISDFEKRDNNKIENKDYINVLKEDESDTVTYTVMFN